MNTEQDVENFWNEVNRLQKLNESPEPVYEYRLYYNESGTIISGYPLIINRPEAQNLPTGPYIVVSKDEYENHSDKIVKNEVLKKRIIVVDVENQLVKSTSGYKVVKNNAALLLDDNDDYRNTEFYDRRTN